MNKAAVGGNLSASAAGGACFGGNPKIGAAAETTAAGESNWQGQGAVCSQCRFFKVEFEVVA